MLKLKNKSNEPRTGFTYHLDNGFMVRGNTLDELITSVKAHMRANKDEIPEDLAEIIEDDICQRNPASMCTGDGPKRFFPSISQIHSGTKAILHAWKIGQKRFVDQKEAERRALICANCRFNIRASGCIGCDALYVLVKKTYNRHTTQDALLRVCGVCECFNDAQVHATKEVLDEALKPGTLENYPDHCWKKHLLGTQDGNEG